MRSRSSAIARRSWRTRSCWRSRPSRSRRICPRGRGSRARSSASSCATSSESTRRSAAVCSRTNFYIVIFQIFTLLHFRYDKLYIDGKLFAWSESSGKVEQQPQHMNGASTNGLDKLSDDSETLRYCHHLPPYFQNTHFYALLNFKSTTSYFLSIISNHSDGDLKCYVY